MTAEILNQVARLSWAEFGIFIDREDPATPAIYFTVPEHSYHKNANGVEMAGDFLAKRFKTTSIEAGIPRATKFLYKIRNGDNWNQGNANQANVAMRACFQLGDNRPFDAFRSVHAKEWQAPESEFNRGKDTRHVYNIFDAIQNDSRLNKQSSGPEIINTPNLAEEQK